MPMYRIRNWAAGLTGGRRDPASVHRVYLGHHKCASSWIVTILRELSLKSRLRYEAHDLPDRLPFDFHDVEPFKTRIHDILQSAHNPRADVIAHVNAYPGYVDALRDSDRPMRAFHVIRDPRDILVSGYYSHRDSHPVHPDRNPWLIQHRSALQTTDETEGMLLELDYVATYFARLAALADPGPDTITVRFEDMTADPTSEWRRILEWLELTETTNHDRHALTDDVVAAIVERHSFKSMRAANPGHYRSGVSGDWQGHFTPSLTKLFDERYGDLLIALGYEHSHDWARATT